MLIRVVGKLIRDVICLLLYFPCYYKTAYASVRGSHYIACTQDLLRSPRADLRRFKKRWKGDVAPVYPGVFTTY